MAHPSGESRATGSTVSITSCAAAGSVARTGSRMSARRAGRIEGLLLGRNPPLTAPGGRYSLAPGAPAAGFAEVGDQVGPLPRVLDPRVAHGRAGHGLHGIG